MYRKRRESKNLDIMKDIKVMKDKQKHEEKISFNLAAYNQIMENMQTMKKQIESTMKKRKVSKEMQELKKQLERTKRYIEKEMEHSSCERTKSKGQEELKRIDKMLED